ncbi:MAG TPA: hypothetical protein VFC46_01515 [Humisphaera sp.]|nr:hypothetical protein [Humisphaera sp.]
MSPKEVYPYRIDEGVFLEDVKILLPWSATVDELATLADARRLPENDPHAVAWGAHKCFGGLTIIPTRGCDSASRFSDAQTFLLRLPDFEHGTAREMWEPELTYLSCAFGAPYKIEEVCEGFESFPHATWYFGAVRLTHIVQRRFVEFNTTMLYRSETAAGYWRYENWR